VVARVDVQIFLLAREAVILTFEVRQTVHRHPRRDGGGRDYYNTIHCCGVRCGIGTNNNM